MSVYLGREKSGKGLLFLRVVRGLTVMVGGVWFFPLPYQKDRKQAETVKKSHDLIIV